MCAPSKTETHYEFRNVPCVAGRQFKTVTDALHAVAAAKGASIDPDARIVRVESRIVRQSQAAEII
jgi:hypothetical protein